MKAKKHVISISHLWEEGKRRFYVEISQILKLYLRTLDNLWASSCFKMKLHKTSVCEQFNYFRSEEIQRHNW